VPLQRLNPPSRFICLTGDFVCVQRLKKQTIGYIMRGMGCFLLTLGALCAKSSVEYFFFASVETTA
jgi:hypothetical protein